MGRALLLQREQPRRKDWDNAMYSALYDADQLLVTFTTPTNLAVVGPQLQGICSALLNILRFAHREPGRCSSSTLQS